MLAPERELRSPNLAGSPWMFVNHKTRIEWKQSRRDGLIGLDQWGHVYRIEGHGTARRFNLRMTKYKVTLIARLDTLYFVVVVGRRRARHAAEHMYVAALMQETERKESEKK